MNAFKRYFLDERQMLLAIVFNALVIFLMYFPEIRLQHLPLYRALDFLDHFFVLIYLLEAVVRIRYMGVRKYFLNKWCLFDFVIVVLSIPGLLNYLGMVELPDTSIIQLLRLFRLARLVRFFRFVPNIRMIVAGLRRALRASVFVFLVLLFLNFILSLFACHFYGDIAPDYFGNPLISSYYIFQMFTVEGWNEIPVVIADAVKQKNLETATSLIVGARLFFIFVVLTGGIFGMSLANAIFVDEMTMDNNRKLEKKIDKMRQQMDRMEELLKEKG